MKGASAGLIARLTAQPTTLARLWRIARKDGTVKRLTDHDVDITVNPGGGNETFLSSAAFSPSAILSTAGSGISNSEMKIAFTGDASGFDELEVLRGVYDDATIKIYLCDWLHPEHGVMTLQSGQLGPMALTNNKVGSFECRGILFKADRTLGEIYTPECRASLGDARCTLNLTAFRHTGTVLTVVSPTVLKIAILDSLPAGAFTLGHIEWVTTSVNDGLAMEIIASTLDANPFVHIVTLALPMPVTPVVPDSCILTEGCDKRQPTCKIKFNNLVNMRAVPFLPGQDGVYEYPIE